MTKGGVNPALRLMTGQLRARPAVRLGRAGITPPFLSVSQRFEQHLAGGHVADAWVVDVGMSNDAVVDHQRIAV